MALKKIPYPEKVNRVLDPNTHETDLRVSARDEDWVEKRELASNPNTPEDVLRDLAKDKDYHVRSRVAENYNSSVNLLIQLFEYEKSLSKPSLMVMLSLYKNPHLPQFAKDVIYTLSEEWM